MVIVAIQWLLVFSWLFVLLSIKIDKGVVSSGFDEYSCLIPVFFEESSLINGESLS
jgi:hypothetical protein